MKTLLLISFLSLFIAASATVRWYGLNVNYFRDKPGYRWDRPDIVVYCYHCELTQTSETGFDDIEETRSTSRRVIDDEGFVKDCTSRVNDQTTTEVPDCERDRECYINQEIALSMGQHGNSYRFVECQVINKNVISDDTIGYCALVASSFPRADSAYSCPVMLGGEEKARLHLVRHA